jgi:hypothetical protein
MDRDLALHLGNQYEKNQKKIGRMLWFLVAAIILLAGEIACLALGLRLHDG